MSSIAALFRLINRHVAWYRLPFPLAIVNLAALRHDLRERNLFSTQRTTAPAPDPGVVATGTARTADGSYNDPADERMGMRDSRMGRNVPLRETFPEGPETLLEPNPRLVSTRLLKRDKFLPIPHLNVLSAAWLQFMVHDWFSHGANAHPSDTSIPEHLRKPIEVPIPPDDDWPDETMVIRRTMPDLPIPLEDKEAPAAYRNAATQWWDASQLYGSSKDRCDELRRDFETGERIAGGKLHLPNGHLPHKAVTQVSSQEQALLEWTGEPGNFWIGLSVLHTLFAREHNLLCDELAARYPDRADDGDWLFDKARLIVSALLAKIHTVEWTPAVLNTRTLRFAMRANWWGILGERFVNAYGRIIKSEILTGIPESGVDHHSAEYSITEEFNAVYRMHSLLPDDFDFRRQSDDRQIVKLNLLDVQGANCPRIYSDHGVELADAIYSLGTEHPGLLKLHNFPRTLTRLSRQAPASESVDVAAIDIVRDRERGIPRYCEFRRKLRMRAPRTFVELTGGDKTSAAELEDVYGDVEKVDLLVGCAAEPWPKGFGFSDTAFRIFILMASRRLKSDRFFASDFNAEVYTSLGLQWVADNSFRSVLLRHLPALAPQLRGVDNAFMIWRRADGRGDASVT